MRSHPERIILGDGKMDMDQYLSLDGKLDNIFDEIVEIRDGVTDEMMNNAFDQMLMYVTSMKLMIANLRD
jgi:hypothetical protein